MDSKVLPDKFRPCHSVGTMELALRESAFYANTDSVALSARPPV